MRKYISLIVLLFALLSCTFAGGTKKIKGNGEVEARTIEIAQFKKIKIDAKIAYTRKDKKDPGNNALNYKQVAGKPSLQITMDKNLFPYLEVESKGDLLVISCTEKNLQLRPTRFIAQVTSEALEGVQISGTLNFCSLLTLKTDELEVDLSGVGNATFANLVCGKLEGDVSGVGNLDLAGKVERAELEVSGVGHVHAFDCEVKRMKCEVSGVGSMEVYATEALEAETSGVGGIKYKGSPEELSKAQTGIGKIKPVKD